MNKTKMIPINNDPKTANGINPAPITIPALIDQNKKAISSGSLMALLKRTIDNAPTIPSDKITFDVIAKIIKVVIKFNASNDTQKL